MSYRDECFDQIGLKASVKIPLFNGALECQFRQYQLFDGKYKAFRSENAGKDFKPRRNTDSPRPKTRSFSRDGEQKGFRKKEDRPSGSRKNEGFRKEEASADARLVTEKNSRANAVTSSGSKTNQNHAHHVLPQTTDARNRLPVHATCIAAANRKSREKTMNQWINNNYRSIKQ